MAYKEQVPCSTCHDKCTNCSKKKSIRTIYIGKCCRKPARREKRKVTDQYGVIRTEIAYRCVGCSDTTKLLEC